MSDFISRLITSLTEVHPIHSMTVHFPIALTGVALLFIFIALWRRDEALEQAAFYCIGLASLSTIVASITGYRDVIVRFEGEAPLVGPKIFLGITLLVLTAIITYARWRQPSVLWTPSTMVLYVAGFVGSFALAITLGFMGGVILYGF